MPLSLRFPTLRLACIGLGLSFAVQAQAQTQWLDASFGSAGLVRTTFSATTPTDAARKGLLLPNGKLIVAGTGKEGFELIRYDANGAPDAGFGLNGKVTSNWTTSGSVIDGARLQTACLQPDGKILAAGNVSEDWAVARYLPDGTLDTSFGANGLVKIPVGAYNGIILSSVTTVLVQSSGHIVLVGEQGKQPRGTDVLVMRLLPNGGLDQSFGVAGTANISNGGVSSRSGEAVVDVADRLVITGTQQNPTSQQDEMFLTRLLPAGTADAGFGVSGRQTLNLATSASGNTTGRAVLVLADGSMLVGGEAQPTGGNRVYVARYTPAGVLDASFGTAGIARFSMVTDMGQYVRKLAVLPTGQLLVAGTVYATTGRFALTWLLPNGTVDAAAGNNGSFELNTSPRDEVWDMVLQPDLKPVLIGESWPFSTSTTTANFLVARLKPAAVLSNQKQTSVAGHVYPNPVAANGIVTLQLAMPLQARAEWRILNSLGQCVAQPLARPGSQVATVHIALPDLANGVYTLQLRTAEGVLNQKMMIEE